MMSEKKPVRKCFNLGKKYVKTENENENVKVVSLRINFHRNTAKTVGNIKVLLAVLKSDFKIQYCILVVSRF